MQGDEFRTAREEMRLSQVEMKEILNTRLSRSYDKSRVSRWENDREPIPGEVSRLIIDLLDQRRAKARIIAFANQKGGVGKTTSALNIASALKRAGQRVLLVDLDPQASASDWLLGHGSLQCYRAGRSIYHVLLKDAGIKNAIIGADEPIVENLRSFDLLTSHIDLAEADSRREPGFERALAESLELVTDDYDFIIIDAPPNLGLMTYMALVAADFVVVPVQTEPPDAMGVALLLDTITKVQRRLNPLLRVTGILPTRYNAKQAVDQEVLRHLIKYTAGRAAVLEPVSESAVFGNAAWSGGIAVDTSPRSKAISPYLRLASAMAARETPHLAVLDHNEDDHDEDMP
ncbi:ParA family protein [Asaia spathodeae]|uniref:ParA family protein n=1 Tax=Asaia spathodeae TaxID=657016 RepID=UPI002FC35F98